MFKPENYSKSVQQAYKEHQSLIIIGLTGKTGSGCSTVAKILGTENFENLDLPTPKDHDFLNMDERKYEVVYQYMQVKGRWKKFRVIHASSIIFSYVLEHGYDKLFNFVSTLNATNGNHIPSNKNLMQDLSKLKNIFDCYCEKYSECFKALILECGHEIPVANYAVLEEFLFEKLPNWRDAFSSVLSSHIIILDHDSAEKQRKFPLYVYFMQTIGNNIRSSGSPYNERYDHLHYYDVAKRMDQIISFIQNMETGDSEIRICIDAIRNSYEAFYFKDKYSSFYLISINTEEQERKRRLGRFNEDELSALDSVENAKDSPNTHNIFFHQNMNECLSISDIHIYNPKQESVGRYSFLSQQILKYICLMLHPGIITPTHIEHCMQIAYVARLNSGCLSRRVGAVITDEDFSINSIGWNDVPKGQVPCNLRCVNGYSKNCDKESFSDFERQDECMQKSLDRIHENVLHQDLLGLQYSYCFKDVYNTINGEHNQVYTRALHAEENAFLQIAKNGGSSIKGGKLFSTASPCELCSKKAFQLGIKEIYYIDPYPGISQSHILQFGTKFRPKMQLFYGAIGSAYIRLYMPRIPIKDEIELLSGMTTKDALRPPSQPHQSDADITKLLKYKQQIYEFIFYSRTKMEERTNVIVSARKPGIVKSIPEKYYWSGGGCEGFTLDRFCSNFDSQSAKLCNDYEASNNLPSDSFHSYSLELESPLHKDEQIEYVLSIKMSDYEHAMVPYYSVFVASQTERLTLSVFEPHGLFKPNSVKFKAYYDNETFLEKNEVTNDYTEGKDYKLSHEPAKEGDVNGTWHKLEILSPRVLDHYHLIWSFSSDDHTNLLPGSDSL